MGINPRHFGPGLPQQLPERVSMSKTLTALFLAAFAFSAQAASHAGAAPMKDAAAAPAAAKAEAAKPAASAAKKAAKAKAEKKPAAAASAAK